MLSSSAKRWMLGAASAAIVTSFSFAAYTDDKSPPHGAKKANINLAVASNFYGVPPSNSAITDLINAFEMDNPINAFEMDNPINAFEMDNPGYTVTVVDNGATATLESNIINGTADG